MFLTGVEGSLIVVLILVPEFMLPVSKSGGKGNLETCVLKRHWVMI